LKSSSPPPPPVFTAPPPDPTLTALTQQTQAQDIAAQQAQTMQDSARLMQQYGMMSTIAGTPTSLSSAAQPTSIGITLPSIVDLAKAA